MVNTDTHQPSHRDRDETQCHCSCILWGLVINHLKTSYLLQAWVITEEQSETKKLQEIRENAAVWNPDNGLSLIYIASRALCVWWKW